MFETLHTLSGGRTDRALRALRAVRLLAAMTVAATSLADTARAATDDEYLAAYRHLQRAQGVDKQGGDNSAIADAIAAFGALHQAEPSNPLVLVNLGAANAMRARTTMLPWNKLAYTEDGLGQQDKALALLAPRHDTERQNGTPITLAVKFIAANTWLAVPGFFNRAARGEKLLAEVLASPLLEQAPLQFRGAVWLRTAKLAREQQRIEDAHRWLEQVVQTTAPQAEQAKNLLIELHSTSSR